MASDLLTKICGEVQQRLDQLHPLVLEYERLLEVERSLGDVDSVPAGLVKASRSGAARSRGRARSTGGSVKRSTGKRKAKPKRMAVDSVGLAILDALEHGSHTVSELVTVTAMGAGEIRGSIRRLLAGKQIAKVDRDGKTAYARQTDSSPNSAGE